MKIVVLAGGISPERDVSLSTGSMVYRALKEAGHDVVMLDVYLGLDGEAGEETFRQEKDWAASVCAIGEREPDLEKIKAMRDMGDQDGDGYFGPNVLSVCKMADMVFLALHGENGENGKIQAAFDLLGIRYTGAGYLGSALALSKRLSKLLFNEAGIPTPGGFSLKKGENSRTEPDYPAVVKTCSGGSSVGVYIVRDGEEYRDALQKAFAYEDEVIVEDYISGREFSVGVIDGKALPVIEIAPISGFYDYKNKYQAGSTVETCPADLPPATAENLQRQAERVFHALGLETYARMDFRLREDGAAYCLEANTLPGMTAMSLIPQEAAAAGMDFVALCERIIQVSMDKYR